MAIFRDLLADRLRSLQRNEDRLDRSGAPSHPRLKNAPGLKRFAQKEFDESQK